LALKLAVECELKKMSLVIRRWQYSAVSLVKCIVENGFGVVFATATYGFLFASIGGGRIGLS